MTISAVMPSEIVDLYLGFVEPPKNVLQATYEELQAYGRRFAVLSLVDKHYRLYFAKILSQLKATAVIKQMDGGGRFFQRQLDIAGRVKAVQEANEIPLPVLQKLFTALRGRQDSPIIVENIKNLVRLILSYQDRIGKALHALCTNSQASLEVVDFLVQQGEKPCRAWISRFRDLSFVNRPMYLIEDTEISVERDLWMEFVNTQADNLANQKHLSAIQETFAKYMKPCLPNLSSMPLAVKERIVSYLVPQKAMKKEGDNQVQMTCTEIKSCARQFLNVALVDKDFHMIVFKISQTLSLFRSMWQLRCQQDLMRKYPYYDQPPYLEGRPYLLDAVCSGCPFTFTPHTFEAFTSDVEKDIETLFNLPRRECQIHERVMMARRISVLGAACINPHVSLDLVKLILYKDDETFDCRIWCFLPWEYPSEGDALLKDVESLRSYLDWERFEAIHALFTEFVAYAVARDEGSDSNYHEYEEEGDFGGHFRSRD